MISFHDIFLMYLLKIPTCTIGLREFKVSCFSITSSDSDWNTGNRFGVSSTGKEDGVLKTGLICTRGGKVATCGTIDCRKGWSRLRAGRTGRGCWLLACLRGGNCCWMFGRKSLLIGFLFALIPEANLPSMEP